MRSHADKTMILGLVLGTEGYGVRRSWLQLFRGFRNQGVTARALLLRQGDMGKALEDDGTSVDYLRVAPSPTITGRGFGKMLSLTRRAMAQMWALRPLLAVIGRRNPQAILLQSPMEVLLVGLAARLSGCRAYWMMPNAISSGYPLDLNRRFYRFIFKYMNVVPVANSRFTDATIGPGNFERHVCYLGIDPTEFDPAVGGNITRRAVGLPEGGIVLGLFARMVAEKGQLRLVEALAELGAEAERVHVLLCGGPLENEYALGLKKFIEASGLVNRVHFLGQIGDVVSHYKLCDVVVNSRLDPEPFGLSVIEGMMLGKPVLAHKAGGPGETVIDGQTGWHIQGASCEDFSAALRRMLADEPRFAELGRAARAHALANFTNEHMAARILEIVDSGRAR